jgi:hypothetical protein
VLDSYEALIPEYISKEEFFRFGLEKTIFIPDEKVKEEWKKLKEKISSNKTVYMRGMKETGGNHLFYEFYDKVLKNKQVQKDPSNTQTPAKIIEDLTGYKKSKDLRNYQLTSIFGRSKNIFAFAAPWNIVYIPSLLDALLGPDAKGTLAEQYQRVFFEHCFKKFKPYISEFNDIVTNMHFQRAVDEYFQRLYEDSRHDKNAVIKFESVLREEFAPIVL